MKTSAKDGSKPKVSEPKTKPAAAPDLPIETPEIGLNIAKTETSAKPFPGRSAASGSNERISIKIVDGKLDHESLRSETAQRFREVLGNTYRDDAMRKWAGLKAEIAEADAIEIVPPALIGNVLDMAANIEASIMASKTGLSYAECQKFLSFNEREHKNLDEQGARLVAKYVPPEWLVKADLWIFLGSLVSLTGVKIQALMQYQKRELEKIGKGEDTRTPTPAPAPVKTDAASPAIPAEPPPQEKRDEGGQSYESQAA